MMEAQNKKSPETHPQKFENLVLIEVTLQISGKY
jgi:hypothetical protein